MMELAMVVAQQNEIAFNPTITGIIALVAGVLILIFPAILNYIVAAWLIIFGIVEIFNISI
jgi:uncharacterized membrane protein HdeD (DUF308 family)